MSRRIYARLSLSSLLMLLIRAGALGPAHPTTTGEQVWHSRTEEVPLGDFLEMMPSSEQK